MGKGTFRQVSKIAKKTSEVKEITKTQGSECKLNGQAKPVSRVPEMVYKDSMANDT